VGQDLSKEEWLQFFEELNRCAVMNVTLQGGEPFCRKDLPELVEGIVRNRMRFNILSNGTLITDEMAAFLASTGRCNGVQVSIDGSVVPVSVRVTIHKQNVWDLENVSKLLLEEVGLSSFSTNAASYMGLCRQNTEQIQLTAEERSLAMKTLLKLEKKYNGRVSATAGPLAEGKDWLEMERACQQKREAIPGRGHLSGCNGPMETLAVRADGVMVPCGQMSHIELGRINRDNLQEIWQEHLELKRLRERHKIPLENFEFCQGCEYINYCTGNCPALAYTILGKENHPSPDACLKRFLEAGGRLPEGIA
jgi:SynChlorMet cassette radical SAM/SPASM protein ScmE